MTTTPSTADRPCHFCQTTPTKLYLLTKEGALEPQMPLDANGRTRNVLPVCDGHLAALQEAGAKGRVHAATGVRWWLGSD